MHKCPIYKLSLEAQPLMYFPQPMALACLEGFGKLPNHEITLFSVLGNELRLFFMLC